jgi:hypothetical protein
LVLGLCDFLLVVKLFPLRLTATASCHALSFDTRLLRDDQ